eukprot:Awhi_evm1s5910
MFATSAAVSFAVSAVSKTHKKKRLDKEIETSYQNQRRLVDNDDVDNDASNNNIIKKGVSSSVRDKSRSKDKNNFFPLRKEVAKNNMNPSSK